MKTPKKSFNSALSPLFEEFVRFRKTSKRWNQTDEITLRAFDKYCAINYPNHKSICEDMLKWCKERPAEHGNSCYRRILIVTKFIEYANTNGHTQVKPPNLPSQKRSTYLPHTFEDEELTRFFAECDRYSLSFDIYKGPNFRTNRLNRIELPVFFRLMFSTGMRTVELRELRRANVDFEHGIININKSKGYGQHRVALHHTTWELLKLYDIKMDSIMPSRTIFFPNTKDQSRPPHWHDFHFRKIWDVVNIAGVRLYDLRSNYAVTNISKWKHLGFTIGEKLIHLSRTMGHSNLNQTYSYFTISPILADKLKDLSEKSFNNLLPKINYNEI